MKIVLSPQACDDLRDISLFIADDNAGAAQALLKRIGCGVLTGVGPGKSTFFVLDAV